MQDSKEIIKNVQDEFEKQQEKINSNIKNWIKTNFYKITTIIALIFAIIGLIMISVNNENKICYLKPDYREVWGNTIIWEHGYVNNGDFTAILYFSRDKANYDDIKWDGKYPEGYFNH